MAEQPKDANIQPPTDTVEKKTTDEKSKDKKEQEEELVKSKRVPGHVVAYTRFMFFVANLVWRRSTTEKWTWTIGWQGSGKEMKWKKQSVAGRETWTERLI